MHRLLIAEADRWGLHALVHDLADEPLHIDTLTDLGAVVSRVAERRADIVLVGCANQPEPVIDTLQALQREHPYTVRLLLGNVAELQAIAAAIREVNVFRLIRKPWRIGALKAALADARSFRTLQQAATTAIERVRDIERTSTLRSVGRVDFGPSGTVIMEPDFSGTDVRDFDWGKSRH
jgi:DNA-binding NtrC family response regulator